jgi:hypothetical protein
MKALLIGRKFNSTVPDIVGTIRVVLGPEGEFDAAFDGKESRVEVSESVIAVSNGCGARDGV